MQFEHLGKQKFVYSSENLILGGLRIVIFYDSITR
jgi:hypothetical protein